MTCRTQSNPFSNVESRADAIRRAADTLASEANRLLDMLERGTSKATEQFQRHELGRAIEAYRNTRDER